MAAKLTHHGGQIIYVIYIKIFYGINRHYGRLRRLQLGYICKACSQWWLSSTLTIIRLQLGYIQRANRVQIPSKSTLEGSKDIFLFRVLLKQITGEIICVNFADASHQRKFLFETPIRLSQCRLAKQMTYDQALNFIRFLLFVTLKNPIFPSFTLTLPLTHTYTTAIHLRQLPSLQQPSRCVCLSLSLSLSLSLLFFNLFVNYLCLFFQKMF